MAGSILTDESCKKLNELLGSLASAACETVVSLIGREIKVTPGENAILDKAQLVSSLKRTYVVAHGELAKDFEGRRLSVMFDITDAIAMSAILMMTPDDVIQERRKKKTLEGEDAEAFGEVASVLFQGIGTLLREEVENIDIEMSDHGQIKGGEDTDGQLANGAVVTYAFEITIGDLPNTTAYFVTDVATAESWNGAPLQAAVEHAEGEGSKGDEDGFDCIPAAPICGKLAAFVTLPEVFSTLKQSCRRIGLELQRHGRGEIPNPAAHRNQIVLIDIPAGEDRQFDWCKRIKDFAADTRVVLLLHHPSRNRVTQAFLSKADAILGLPCEEAQLSQKLTALLNAPTEPVGCDDDDKTD